MASFDKPVVCPVVVGRDEHLDLLGRLLEQVRTGSGQTLLVTGDAGIGKSRLVAEARATAQRLGMTVLQGNCFETDSYLPYAPLVDLLRGHLGFIAPSEIASRLESDASDFVKLLPELAPHVPPDAPSIHLDAEQEKRRIFQSLIRLFGKYASVTPVLLVIEDVHWCDDVSLEFLRHLTRQLASQPILLLLTFRPDEAPFSLRHLLTELNRARMASTLRLAPLASSDVESMMRAIFDLQRPVPADFLEAVYSLTEGNPFFIEEALRSMIATEDIFDVAGDWNSKLVANLSIPLTVQEAVRRRTEQLEAGARDTLSLAAVAGRRFDFALLQHLAQRDEREVLQEIKALIAAQLVVEEADGRFAFRHALTRQSIYMELLTRERIALHRLVGEAMETLFADSLDARAADLGYHFFEAGEWERAMVYSQRAGDQACALYASGAAIQHFTRALDASARIARTPPMHLYRARGIAYETLGEFDKAQSDLQAALRTATADGERPSEWQILLDLGFLWAGRDYAMAGDYFQRALALARTMDDPSRLAHSLNRVGNWLLNTGRDDEGMVAHREALAIFESAQDLAGTAETLDLLGMASGIAGAVASGVSYYGRAIELFHSLGDNLNLVSSLASRAIYGSPALSTMTSSSLTPPAESERDASEASRLAGQIGSLTSQAYVEWTHGGALAGYGDFGSGLSHARHALRIATEIEHQQWQTAAYYVSGYTYVLMLAPERAIESLELGLTLARDLGSAWWIGGITAMLASARLMAGDKDGAEAALQAVMPLGQIPRSLVERAMAMAWSMLMLEKGDSESALRLAEQLLNSVPDAVPGQPIPTPLLVKGRSLLALGRPVEALDALLAAKAGAQSRHDLPLLWRVQSSLCHLYHALGQEQEAQRESLEAQGVIARLADSINDRTLREQFLNRVGELFPKARVPTPRQVEAARFQGLTEREREVAALVAQGMSNRAIAETIVVSERTAEAHVSKILSKLGLNSRAQIAVWAAERGLTDRDT